MAVVVPSGQVGQFVGLPPLSDETYVKLDATMKKILAPYYANREVPNTSDPSDYYSI